MMYAGLFLSALASATLLPGSSEAALLALLATGNGDPALLVAAATAGNVAGSLLTWGLGRYVLHLSEHPWFPVRPTDYTRAAGWFRRYGIWLLLFSWVPVVGDPLTLAAGAARVRLLPFLLLVSLGKAGRYLAIFAAFAAWDG
ncbi:YqaA family protein [Paracoccus fontiphilus]|uniref:YqaA family protein n=1 Tax=Paracoccus fontiphilus TaxID=1815556 RepID=A0ABV7I7V5_9RHOB